MFLCVFSTSLLKTAFSTCSGELSAILIKFKLSSANSFGRDNSLSFGKELIIWVNLWLYTHTVEIKTTKLDLDHQLFLKNKNRKHHSLFILISFSCFHCSSYDDTHFLTRGELGHACWVILRM